MEQLRSIFLVLSRFKGPEFLEALRKGGATGNLQVTGVSEDGDLDDDVVVPLACSGFSLQDAADLAVAYASDRYPKLAPDSVAVVKAPDKYLKTLSKRDRAAFEKAAGVKEEWDGPIVVGSGNRDYPAVADLAFDLRELAWTEFPCETFSKKYSAQNWRDEQRK